MVKRFKEWARNLQKSIRWIVNLLFRYEGEWFEGHQFNKGIFKLPCGYFYDGEFKNKDVEEMDGVKCLPGIFEYIYPHGEGQVR